MKKQEIFISDIFCSIQGEGAKIGTPSIFIRLGVCNLQCVWCDTPYTWKKGMTDYTLQSQEAIIKKVQEFRKKQNIHNVVVTGGEPLLQQKQLVRLLSEEIFNDMAIEFETNGSMPLLPEMQKFLENRRSTVLQKFPVSFNISPKLTDSGNKSYKPNIYPNAVLKFVYVSSQTEKLINQFIQENSQTVADTPIYIMPEGTTIESMSQKYEAALHYCLKNGYRFTPRLHIYLFGNTRAT